LLVISQFDHIRALYGWRCWMILRRKNRGQSTICQIAQEEFRAVSSGRSKSESDGELEHVWHLGCAAQFRQTVPIKTQCLGDWMQIGSENPAHLPPENLDTHYKFSAFRYTSEKRRSFSMALLDIRGFSSAHRCLQLSEDRLTICEAAEMGIQSLTDHGCWPASRRRTMSRWDSHISDCDTRSAFIACRMWFLTKILDLTGNLSDCRSPFEPLSMSDLSDDAWFYEDLSVILAMTSCCVI
jgi:hypothetical protein